MLSFREKLAKGIFESVKSSVDIPKKSAFLGTITEDGYCDYDVPEDTWYLSKDNKRGLRLHQSNTARKNRKEIKRIRFGL
jgi:hypothetical protein